MIRLSLSRSRSRCRSLSARRLAVPAAAVLLAASAGAHAFIETHLDEIAQPLGAYAAARVAAIDALPAPGKATKKERKLLLKLSKKEGKVARSMKSDFKELLFAGKTAKKLKDAAAGMGDALDEAFARAEIALGERREFVGDHVALISDPRALQKIRKKIAAFDAARAAARSAADDAARSKAYAKAEKSITAALKRAEKGAQKVVNASTSGLRMPPIRLRSGDDVGAGGARVAIPAAADSPLAGASVIIPPGALASTRRITIEPGTSFVGGRDVAAGPSVRFLPAGVAFNQPVRVAVPFVLPPDVDAADLALFHSTGAGVTATLDVTIEPSSTLSGEATSFAEFQAGVLAPPLGAPSGTYHVQMIFVSHVLSPDGAVASEENIGVTGQDWSFRADGSGRREPGSAPLVFRGFTAASPFHIDGFSPGLVGSVDYAWELVEAGRFTFEFPTAFGVTATAEAIVSQTGDVIAFVGRGGAFEFLGVGVRDDVEGAGNADLSGRWLAVELGAQLVGAGQSPFTSRYVSSFTSFEADSDTATLTFDAGGASFLTDRTFDPGGSGAHDVTAASAADGGSEDFFVLPSGQVQADQQRRAGWVHPAAGIFISTHADRDGRAIELMVAVRQPATVAPETFRGDFRIARLDLTAREDGADAFRSFLDVDPGVGTFTVVDGGRATVALEPVERASYALAAPPTSGAAAWTSSVALAAATPPADVFDLILDAAGNDRSPGATRWYGISSDGGVLLGTSQATSALRSLLIGLR